PSSPIHMCATANRSTYSLSLHDALPILNKKESSNAFANLSGIEVKVALVGCPILAVGFNDALPVSCQLLLPAGSDPKASLAHPICLFERKLARAWSGSLREGHMKSSFVGRGLAYAVILAVIAWTAVRALGE